METKLRLRNNVNVVGHGERPMIFAHGYGCDQNMWRFVAPEFEKDFKVILFDHVGCGRSDLSAYDASRYSTLQAYADDVVELARALQIQGGVFVGHSVSAMIGALAAISAPDLFEELVMVCPSPCYINDGDYAGGFTRQQIFELLDFLDDNHLGWSAAMAPVIMGTPDRVELVEELENSFCRTDPDIAKAFARVTFTSDNRMDLPQVAARSVIVQCQEDVIAPPHVGEYVARMLPDGRMVTIKARGHCPNLSAPADVIKVIRDFV